MTDLAALLDVLDEGERVRGRGFERLCGWVLENEPEYAAQLERVWLWDEWPGNLGRSDAGIDLVARTRDGKLWAVQAKHYGPERRITKGDVNSFLAEAGRYEFDFLLLVTSGSGVSDRHARGTLADHGVGVRDREWLLTLDLDWNSFLAGKPSPPRKPIKPRSHQREAVVDVVEGLASQERCQLVMACGTGKTLVARFIHDVLGSRRTLVLLPSLSLVEQTISEWFRVGDFDYLAVCSDKTVAEHDAVVASTSELGVPVTTDPVEIAAFLRKRCTRSRVVFATYQSSPQVAQAQAGRMPAFDLVVADEAHRCAGPEAGVFATVLDGAKIKARKRLFMTATPRYYTGRLRKEASEADWEIASMDDEQKFGPVLHRLTFAQAVDQDLLCDYQVVVVGVTDASYREMAQRAAFVSADGKTVTDARTLASQLGLLRAMRNHDLRRVVTFHSRIANARSMARTLPEVRDWMPARRRPSGKLWTQHVSGEMTSGERKHHLKQLREIEGGERGVLTNARCLTEGVDVPTLDGVAFIDPRWSQVDIVQAVGRAMRKADDKTVGTIVIPVFVDEVADPEEALDSSEFKRVWSVVKALRAHDDVLAEELDALRREHGRRRSSGGRPTKLVLDLPVGVGTAFAHAFDTKVVETSTTTWEEGLGAAGAYRDAEGDLRVPAKFVTDDGFKLGVWINTRRSDHKEGSLTAERVAELDALGFVWDPFDEDWQRGIEAARAYREEYGHLRVPPKFTTADGFPLGKWISHRRLFRRKGTLRAERVAALDALDMIWDAPEEDWRRGLAAARAYREERGDLLVAQSFVTDDGFPLGTWISGRRSGRKRNALSPARIEELDALGMIWDARADWERGIAAARAFREVNGDLRVRKGFIASDGFLLGQWISARRTERRREKLADGQIAELDALGMVWDARTEDWQRGVEAARAYHEANGDLRVRKDVVAAGGFRLGAWISERRAERSGGHLSAGRVEELDALDMIWDARAENWRRGLDAASAFRQSKGHLRVPQGFVSDDGFKLGTWIAARRQDWKRGKLAPERVAALDTLDMVWDTRNAT